MEKAKSREFPLSGLPGQPDRVQGVIHNKKNEFVALCTKITETVVDGKTKIRCEIYFLCFTVNPKDDSKLIVFNKMATIGFDVEFGIQWFSLDYISYQNDASCIPVLVYGKSPYTRDSIYMNCAFRCTLEKTLDHQVVHKEDGKKWINVTMAAGTNFGLIVHQRVQNDKRSFVLTTD